MSDSLLFTISHGELTLFTKDMTIMMPEIMPLKKGIVYATGCIEIIAAVELQVSPLRELTA